MGSVLRGFNPTVTNPLLSTHFTKKGNTDKENDNQYFKKERGFQPILKNAKINKFS